MEKQKLLIQVQGSAGDPAYDAQMISVGGENIPFLEYFHKNGIKTLDRTLVASCHGNTKLTLKHAEDIQNLADEGHKVAVIAQGGLYFALPSIIAANAPTVPVISVPLDARSSSYKGLDAFLAPQVPSGTASIGGVGISRYDAAAGCAKEILTNEFDGVYLLNPSKTLEKKLEELGIPVKGKVVREFLLSSSGDVSADSLKSGLVICRWDYDNEDLFNELVTRNLGIMIPTITDDEDLTAYLMHCFPKKGSCVYVRGDDNAAFFAAKIVSQYNEKAFNALKEAAKKKAESYEKRDITPKSFVGGK